MLTADTNVWARALLDDDKTQSPKAKAALTHARAASGVFVPLLVLAELTWVLRTKWERDMVLDAVGTILRTRGIQVELPELVRKAIHAARGSSTGLADHLIAEVSLAAGAKEVVTFDKAFARKPGVRRLA